MSTFKIQLKELYGLPENIAKRFLETLSLLERDSARGDALLFLP